MSKKVKQTDRDKYFDAAFAALMDNEGGYANDPDDPGGETKYGISRKSYPDLDIAALTEEDARAIYRTDFWDALSLSEVTSPDIAGEIFDTAVNMGKRIAAVIAQKALKYLGEDLKVDGIIGPKTLAALNRWGERDPRALFVCLNGFQFMEYTAIINSRPALEQYGRGWTRRIQEYRG
jgi:lysozyme family protein